MAHVEVAKLAPQELAELACSYAALILHDDGQDVTGTPALIQAIRSASWSLHLVLRSNRTGPSSSQRPWPARTSVPSSISEESPAVPLPLHQLHLLPLRRRPTSLLRRRRRRRRKPLLLPPRRKKKIWIWEDSSIDRIDTLEHTKYHRGRKGKG